MNVSQEIRIYNTLDMRPKTDRQDDVSLSPTLAHFYKRNPQTDSELEITSRLWELWNSELLHYRASSRSLRSSSQRLLSTPGTSLKTYGDRAFSAAGPRLWNELPLSLRSSNTLTVFKKRLICLNLLLVNNLYFNFLFFNYVISFLLICIF